MGELEVYVPPARTDDSSLGSESRWRVVASSLSAGLLDLRRSGLRGAGEHLLPVRRGDCGRSAPDVSALLEHRGPLRGDRPRMPALPGRGVCLRRRLPYGPLRRRPSRRHSSHEATRIRGVGRGCGTAFRRPPEWTADGSDRCGGSASSPLVAEVESGIQSKRSRFRVRRDRLGGAPSPALVEAGAPHRPANPAKFAPGPQSERPGSVRDGRQMRRDREDDSAG